MGRERAGKGAAGMRAGAAYSSFWADPPDGTNGAVEVVNAVDGH